ncbi:MAG: PIN domain-containing protein [Cellulomonadaceae bacterium]|jgi:predicted nucleic acid-binding protein|nr:PIN domain-containing protein [Cellulomonadaceae bacterium]
MVRTWYIDTNVLVGIITRRSPAAVAWFQEADARGDVFISSSFLKPEVLHVVNRSIAQDYLQDILLLKVDNDLMEEAAAIPGALSGADAIHIASAERIRNDNPIIVTHDAQMARAAKALAFEVLDPITDDPNRPPAA